jgi:O-antigen ligase
VTYAARAVIVLSRGAWGLGALVALTLLVTFLRTDVAVVPLRAGVGALALLGCWMPAAALLGLAALLPLAGTVARLSGGPISGPVVAEALVLAALAPWLARKALRLLPPSPPEQRCAPPAALFAAILAASCAVQIAELAPQMGTSALVSELWSFLTAYYFERSSLFGMIVATAANVEGLGLLLMTAWITGRDADASRRLVIALVAASAGAAALNLHHLLSLASADAAPLAALRELWLQARISLQVDRNAAGSLFAMMGLLATGLWPGSRGWVRTALLVAMVLIGAGLWMTGSRVAMAGVVAGAVLLIALLARGRSGLSPGRALGAAVAVVLVATAGAAVYPSTRNPSVAGSLTGRQELAIAAVEMWAAHPVFGSGIGRFYARSNEYGHPQMSLVLPPGSAGENAHNNFLQVLAELGIAGFAAFLWVLGTAAAPAVLAIRSRALPPVWLGVTAGVATFMGTWLTGHPLLVPETLYLFLIVLGILAAAPLPGMAHVRWSRRALAAVASVIVIGALPLRMQEAVDSVDLEHMGLGVSVWQRDPVVERYRWAEKSSTVFVPTRAGVIDVPLKAGAGTVDVELWLDGRLANRVVLSDRDWTHVRLVVAPAKRRFRRLELRGTSSTGIVSLMVGKAVGAFGDLQPVVVPPGPAVRARAAGDFDGDGASDVLIYEPAEGTWRAGNRVVERLGGPGEVPAPGDYDGDGRTEIAKFREADGTWRIAGGRTVQLGGPGDVPVPGDYDGDGRAEAALFAPQGGAWRFIGRADVMYGDPGDVPVPGDYDGDGRLDVAVYRPSTTVWYVRDQFATQFGDPADLPVPGDYDGDGTTDLAVFRPSDRTWYVRGQRAVVYGAPGDVPLPGDYDGDGRTDIAVYRPVTGKWFVFRETSSGLLFRLWWILSRR